MKDDQSEHQIQSAFFQWITVNEKRHPELSLAFAIPNGTNKSIAARVKYKREGLKPGVPDVCLPLSSRMKDLDYQFCGLFIEFKAKKGVLSPAQKEWIERLRKENHRVEVVRSWTDAANIVIEYLDLGIKV